MPTSWCPAPAQPAARIGPTRPAPITPRPKRPALAISRPWFRCFHEAISLSNLRLNTHRSFPLHRSEGTLPTPGKKIVCQLNINIPNRAVNWSGDEIELYSSEVKELCREALPNGHCLYSSKR